jgi:hypothetical protein
LYVRPRAILSGDRKPADSAVGVGRVIPQKIPCVAEGRTKDGTDFSLGERQFPPQLRHEIGSDSAKHCKHGTTSDRRSDVM